MVNSVSVLVMIKVEDVVVWEMEKLVMVVLVVVCDKVDITTVVSTVVVVVVFSVFTIDTVLVTGTVTIDVISEGCKMNVVVSDRKTTVLVVRTTVV